MGGRVYAMAPGSDDDVGCRARTSNVTLDNGKGINKAKVVNNNFTTRQDILYQLSRLSISGRIIFFRGHEV